MKYARCPKCKGRLGIPNKKRGLPVQCPKCTTEFVAPDHLDTDPAKSKKKPNGSPKKPSMRSLPLPEAIAGGKTKTKTKTEPATNSGTIPTKTIPMASSADPMMPPTKQDGHSIKSNLQTQPNAEMMPPGSAPSPARDHAISKPNPLDAPKPVRSDRMPPAPTAKPLDSAAPINSAAPTTPAALPTPSPKEHKKVVEVTPTVVPAKQEPSRSVARIVKTESVAPQLSKDGKLPTLQLADDEDTKEVQTKTNPVLLTAVVCTSLFLSTLMIVFLSGGDSEKKAKLLEESRRVVQTFYEIRPDQELKPFQRELRKAQLAHSRQDYEIAIRAYESVMSRLNSEEHNEYSGVTGTALSDLQLRKHVSILLTEAKRKRR